MRNIAEFTTAEGRRIGIPVLGGLIILDTIVSPLENQPNGAKTLIRYIIGGEQGARIAWVKDPFKHVISKMPVSACGPWAHGTDHDGNNIVFPKGSIGAYHEIENDKIDVTLAIPTGPVDIRLRGKVETILEIAGDAAGDVEPQADQSGGAEAGAGAAE